MWREFLILWHSVRDPEYAHLLLESLPLYGLGLGLTFLIVAFAFHERKSQLLALVVICVSCASVWPYLDFRLKATPRILATHDSSLAPLIREQTKRRQDYGWLYYVMAGLTGITLLLSATKHGKYLLFLTVCCGVMLFWLSVWLHKKEGEVYHRNIIRYQPPAR